ncbi:MAG TPA: DNRLRE domain-containing protein, partial [Candidatus Dormibacteraeota bacterium]|nr:DNRLRE domain-containing protein [Candidatus Dormibacteraeota bacterium]
MLAVGLLITSAAVAGTVTVQTNILGPTPSILAYNAGHFVPGSNTRDWWRYSGTTGARVFITPDLIEPSDDIPGRGDGVTDQASFLSRRAALRANPLDTNYINWPYFTNNFGLTQQHGSNLLNPNDACTELRQIGVQILACLTASETTFPLSDSNDWAGKWELWQHYYAEAFYLSRYFDVQRFQMYNEPNLSSTLTADEFLDRLKIISDAVQSALADVNQLYGKSLTAQMFTPVAAGTASSTYPSWGKMVVTNRHTDFLGQTSPSFGLLQKYDYHEYNSTPANFGANLGSLNTQMASDMSPEARFPTSISEFNVHTAGTFDTLTDTLDSPAQYARFGSVVVNLAKNFCDELYCFKFSQTLNTTTVKKNGMHFVDNTNAPYNIGGVTKAGEVWRLFSQPAAPGRNRLSVSADAASSGLDLIATYDPATQYYYLFSANMASNLTLNLNVGAWNIRTGQVVGIQEVSEGSWGGARALTSVSNNQITAGTQGTNTVLMFTIPTKAQEAAQTIGAVDDAIVQDGAGKSLNFGSSNVCIIRNSSTNASLRSAALLKFHLPLIYHDDIQLALLAVRASSLNGSTNVQAHVYGLANTNWSQGTVTWTSGPNLAQNIAPGSNYINNFVTGAGSSAQLVGQLVADNASVDRFIDVTKYLQNAPWFDVSFLLAREVRFFGDVQDNDGMVITSK